MHTYPYDIVEKPGGSLDVTIHLGPVESQAVNSEELHELIDGLHSVLWGLGMLRLETVADPAGVRTPEASDWHHVIDAVHKKLIGRLEGVGDAAVRAHHAAGGTVGQLATAMDVARSTAQHRRDVILAARPSGWEKWAVDDRTRRPGTDDVPEGE